MHLQVHPLSRGVYAFTFGRGVFRLANVRAAVCACDRVLSKPRYDDGECQ